MFRKMTVHVDFSRITGPSGPGASWRLIMDDKGDLGSSAHTPYFIGHEGNTLSAISSISPNSDGAAGQW